MKSSRVLVLVATGVLLSSLLSIVRAEQCLWTIQIASRSGQREAEEEVRALRARGFDAYWITSTVPGMGVRYRVRVGRFADRAEARASGERLRTQKVVRTFFVAECEELSNPAVPTPAPQAETVTRALWKQPKVGQPRFVTFEDEAAGYSLDYPHYWKGSAWSDAKRRSQGVDAGASFKSKEDSAFCNVIWNKLPDASDDQKLDNTMLVDTILKSMTSGTDTTTLSEISRTVERDGTRIRTYLELSASFRDTAGSAARNFLGKAVVARFEQGVLLVVVFYAADAPPVASANAEKIIRSVRGLQG
jgi:hypothetical protein